MESRLERHDGIIGRTWSLVEHDGFELLLRWHNIHTTAFLLSISDEGKLEGRLDRACTAHSTADTSHTSWFDIHEGLIKNLFVLQGRVDADTCASDEHLSHQIRLGSFECVGMVVPHADASDASEDIKERVSISISDVVSKGFVHVNREVSLLAA